MRNTKIVFLTKWLCLCFGKVDDAKPTAVHREKCPETTLKIAELQDSEGHEFLEEKVRRCSKVKHRQTTSWLLQVTSRKTNTRNEQLLNKSDHNDIALETLGEAAESRLQWWYRSELTTPPENGTETPWGIREDEAVDAPFYNSQSIVEKAAVKLRRLFESWKDEDLEEENVTFPPSPCEDFEKLSRESVADEQEIGTSRPEERVHKLRSRRAHTYAGERWAYNNKAKVEKTGGVEFYVDDYVEFCRRGYDSNVKLSALRKSDAMVGISRKHSRGKRFSHS